MYAKTYFKHEKSSVEFLGRKGDVSNNISVRIKTYHYRKMQRIFAEKKKVYFRGLRRGFCSGLGWKPEINRFNHARENRRKLTARAEKIILNVIDLQITEASEPVYLSVPTWRGNSCVAGHFDQNFFTIEIQHILHDIFP